MTDETKIDFAPGRDVAPDAPHVEKKKALGKLRAWHRPLFLNRRKQLRSMYHPPNPKCPGKNRCRQKAVMGRETARYSRLSVPRWKKKRRIRLRICSRILRKLPQCPWMWI